MRVSSYGLTFSFVPQKPSWPGSKPFTVCMEEARWILQQSSS
jgi:hypothetical protein